MNPDEKTRLLIGSLVAAVALVVGYGSYQALNPAPEATVQQIAQETAQATAQASAQPSVPGMPVLRLQADSPVTAGTDEHQASVTSDTDLAYEWSIQGGTFEGSPTGASVTWTAGTGTEAILTCKGTNAADKTSTVTLRVPLRQTPAITRFEGQPLVLTEGSSARLSWTVANTEKLVLEPGGQEVSGQSGMTQEVKPEKTTTYILTATNSTGVPATRELLIKVVAPPEITGLRADPTTGTPNAFTVIGEFKGGKAELKRGTQVVASSEVSPLRVSLTDLKDGASVALTVTNEAGTYLSSTLTFSTPKK